MTVDCVTIQSSQQPKTLLGCYIHLYSTKNLRRIADRQPNTIFKSGRDADVFSELEIHREVHCLKGKARGENCPYNAEHMRGGQLMHQWCRCSGARLIGHIDPMWTLAQAEEPGSALECALRAVPDAAADAAICATSPSASTITGFPAVIEPSAVAV